jgi:hypothetical protein
MSRPDRALILYEQALYQEPHRLDLHQRIDEMKLVQGVGPPLPDN